MKSATKQECSIFLNTQFISSTNKMGQMHPQTPPSYPCVTSLSSLLLNITLWIFKSFRSLNFARSTNYQKKLVTSILKLACSEVSALNESSFLSLIFFFIIIIFFYTISLSNTTLLSFAFYKFSNGKLPRSKKWHSSF